VTVGIIHFGPTFDVRQKQSIISCSFAQFYSFFSTVTRIEPSHDAQPTTENPHCELEVPRMIASHMLVMFAKVQ